MLKPSEEFADGISQVLEAAGLGKTPAGRLEGSIKSRFGISASGRTADSQAVFTGPSAHSP